MNLAGLLTERDIEAIIRRHQTLETEFRSLHSLDQYDWMVAGIAGVLAALVEIFLVDVPKHPGFLGGKASEGGWRTQLFLGHSIATAANAGRVCITHNPMALNWAQWLACYRYLLPQVCWLLTGAERARAAHVQGQIQVGWQRIDEEFEELWRNTFDGDPAVL